MGKNSHRHRRIRIALLTTLAGLGTFGCAPLGDGAEACEPRSSLSGGGSPERALDGTFDSGSIFPPYAQGLSQGPAASASISAARAPGGVGGRAVKLVVPRSQGSRANVPSRRLLDVPDFSWRSGDEYWYGIRFWFGRDWQLEDVADNRQQFVSLLSFRYADGDERSGTGSIKAIAAEGGPRLVHARAALSVNAFGDNAGEDPLDLGPIVKNRWMNLVCRFKWSARRTGALKECWRDGEHMGRSTRRNMTVDRPVVQRVGLYQGTAVDHTRTLFWDNHRIGRSYTAVDPDCR